MSGMAQAALPALHSAAALTRRDDPVSMDPMKGMDAGRWAKPLVLRMDWWACPGVWGGVGEPASPCFLPRVVRGGGVTGSVPLTVCRPPFMPLLLSCLLPLPSFFLKVLMKACDGDRMSVAECSVDFCRPQAHSMGDSQTCRLDWAMSWMAGLVSCRN